MLAPGVSWMFESSIVIGALLGIGLSTSFAIDWFTGRQKRAQLAKKID